MGKYKFIYGLAFLVFSHGAHAFSLEGRVVGIADGDTLTLLDANNHQHRIRLAQIDAPEIQHGAKNRLKPLVSDRANRSLRWRMASPHKLSAQSLVTSMGVRCAGLK